MIAQTLRNEILPQVQKPGQYLGNEWGAAHKDWDSAKSRMVLIYPDLYELGMSNFGIKILYNIVNNHPDYLCDRAYAVMPDMEELMRKHDLPLWSWEANQPLNEFDFMGFSLAYELCYTNVLNVLDLARVPLKSEDRTSADPLVFAGGPACFNPEPMAEYFDFFIIGDGEELIQEIQDLRLKFLDAVALKRCSAVTENLREQLLLELSQLDGIYVPSLYEPDENHIPKPLERYSVTAIQPPAQVRKRITQNLDDHSNPVTGPVPHIKTVQDKQVLEIRRGCDRGCRFCQVGYTYLPVRERKPEDLLRLSTESIEKSGYEDMTLLSLSASDYTCLTEAAHSINEEHARKGIALSMPSQRADRFNVHLADEVSGARKSGMTFAPEAGSERMRRIINKGLSESDIKRAIKGCYDKGWKQIKLYFMIGLPFEEDSDLDGILDILEWAARLKPLKINCTISTFVPKTFTAFQWFPQVSIEEFHRKQQYLKDGLWQRRIAKKVKLNCTEPELAQIESVLSRGDRRWGEVIEKLWRSGSRMDSWSEHFDIKRWQEAAQACGLDLHEEVIRYREPGSKQPWDVLSIGFTDKFLLNEWQQAEAEIETAPCTENKCHACGVCFNLDVKNVVNVDLSDGNPYVQSSLRAEAKQSSQEVIKQEWLIKAQKYSSILFFMDLLLSFGLDCFAEARNDGAGSKKNKEPKVIVEHTIAQQRLRLKITKLGDFKFVSHLDFQRLLERALRRSGLPFVHTRGFNQRIKISWMSALSLFTESFGEYLILELARPSEDLDKLKEILNQELPEQARIVEVTEISSKDRLSLEDIQETVYIAKLIQANELKSPNDNVDTNNEAVAGQQYLESRLETFLSQGAIEITVAKAKDAKGKSKNIREGIIAMKFLDSSQLELRLKPNQRVDQVLEALLPNSSWSISKMKQIFKTDNALELV
ncbi:MAG: TIGR03960 family B12-binding radical SAM protein [Candidatus Melainabacteria bacterium]|nr:TIGR03960 family B12-binding radical SAM protein [Candidatus Melainabacteria bacterium]